MIAPAPRPSKTWAAKIPCDGGPVSFLTIHDRAPDLRTPIEMSMGEQGAYHYDAVAKMYRWRHP